MEKVAGILVIIGSILAMKVSGVFEAITLWCKVVF